MPGVVLLLLAFLAFECVAIALVRRATRRDQDALDDEWADRFIAEMTGVLGDATLAAYEKAVIGTERPAATPVGFLGTGSFQVGDLSPSPSIARKWNLEVDTSEAGDGTRWQRVEGVKYLPSGQVEPWKSSVIRDRVDRLRTWVWMRWHRYPR